MKRILIIAIALLTWVAGAWAQTTASLATQTSLLQTVVVTTSRASESKREVASHVTVIDKLDIEKSRATSLDELLSTVGMGHIHRYPSGLSAITMRGYNSDILGNDLQGHVLILQDGRRIGSGNAAQIPLQSIECIEIVRGPAAVQYGAAAMGGVINIITKRGEGNPQTTLQSSYGSNSYQKQSVSFSGATEGIDMVLSAFKQSAGDYKTSEGRVYFNTGYDKDYGASINLGYTPADGQRLGIIYTHYKLSHQGNPSYLSQNDLDDYNNALSYAADLSYEGASPERLYNWKARYFTGKNTNEWFEPLGSNPTGWNSGGSSWRETNFQGAQAQLSLERGYYTLTGGFDALLYNIENSWLPKRTSYLNPAVFLLGKLRLLEGRLVLSGGRRYDQYMLEVENPQGRKESDQQATKRLGAAFMLTENLKVRAHYGEAFIMPGAEQMAADYLIWGKRQLGNPNLKPEKGQTLEGGVDYGYGSLEVSFTYFVSSYQDKIQAATTANGENTWENIGKAEIRGMEADISYDIGALFAWRWVVKPSLKAVYFTRYRDEISNKELLHMGSQIVLGVTLAHQDDFWAQLQASYWSPQRVEDFASGIFPTPEVKKGGFSVVDLTAEKTIFQEETLGRLSINFAINNLLAHNYAHVLGYPLPGRQFLVGLQWRF